MNIIKNKANNIAINKWIPGETVFLTGLLVAAFFMPAEQGPSLCFFKWAGISWCPGCGIGHSIRETLHLNFAGAWAHHYFGIPAVAIILFQIFKKLNFKRLLYGY